MLTQVQQLQQQPAHNSFLGGAVVDEKEAQASSKASAVENDMWGLDKGNSVMQQVCECAYVYS
jgi:hypothetical protein